jgi:hypothetical protein
VTGSLAYLHDESAAAMDLIASGHVRVEPLHDATVPLERAADTFATLADDPGAAVKVPSTPTDGAATAQACALAERYRQPVVGGGGVQPATAP